MRMGRQELQTKRALETIGRGRMGIAQSGFAWVEFAKGIKQGLLGCVGG